MDAEFLKTYLETDGPIPGREIEAAFQTNDLLKIGILWEIVSSHWNRVNPKPDSVKCCRSIARYLLLCIERNPESQDFVCSNYEAARDLVSLMRHCEQGGLEHQSLMSDVIEDLRQLYLRSDNPTRLCIETGFLEHFLENRAFLKWMKCWENDAATATAIADSLRWSDESSGA